MNDLFLMSSSNVHINYAVWKGFVESVGFMFDNFLEIFTNKMGTHFLSFG